MTKLKKLIEAHREDWIGVDLDGTLAHYDGFKGTGIIGEPIPRMVDRVKAWLAQGRLVKIMTARVASTNENRAEETEAIHVWTEKYLGQMLEATAEKDFHMTKLYDDRAIQVKKNTGELVEPKD